MTSTINLSEQKTGQSFAQLMGQFAHCKEQLELYSKDAEANFCYPQEAIDVARKMGFWNFVYPQDAGGNLKYNKELIDLWQASSHLDGSFGWLSIAYVLAASHCSIYLTDQGFEQVFGTNQVPIIAGQYQPNGKAQKQPGGYSLTGNWHFGSGIHHADWVVAGFIELESGKVKLLENGEPEIKIAVIKAKDIELHGNWSTTGLSGTGSVSYRCTELWVDESMVFSFSKPKLMRGQGVHTLGLLPTSAISHGCWALGMSKRLLDEIRRFAKRKTRAGEKLPLWRKESFQLSYGQAVAKYEASYRFICTAVDEAVEKLHSDNVAAKEYPLIRLAATYANDVSQQLAEFVATHLGAASTDKRNPIERVLRDIHTGRHHMMISQQSYVNAAESLLADQ